MHDCPLPWSPLVEMRVIGLSAIPRFIQWEVGSTFLGGTFWFLTFFLFSSASVLAACCARIDGAFRRDAAEREATDRSPRAHCRHPLEWTAVCEYEGEGTRHQVVTT